MAIMASSTASTSASMLPSKTEVETDKHQHKHEAISAPSLAHLYVNHTGSPRTLFARSRTSSIGIDVAAASSGSIARSRAGSVGPRESPQTPSPPPFDMDTLDRGPGTPDFTLDRFASIRGSRQLRHPATRQHTSLSAIALSDRTKARQTASYPVKLLRNATNAFSAIYQSIAEARMPPLRPHLPALLFLVSIFVGSTVCILLALSTLPLRLPSHITDLTLAEIRDMSMSLRTYSHSSSRAFAHTLAVLGAFFTWKQSFTVPGSLIMNVVFGAMYGPFWGTLFTSLLTALGGMFCYLLVQPIGPLISAVPGFGKGLQKMRKALQGSAGYTIPPPHSRNTTVGMTTGLRSPLAAPVAKHHSLRLSNRSPARKVSRSSKKVGKRPAQDSLWSYLLVLRLLPIVPYGLMNIACAVLQVPLVPYTVTLALGSIPWNACTVQIGDLLLEVVSALPVATVSPDLGSQLGNGGFVNAPAPGSHAPQATNAVVQTGLQAITEKIWNREMLFKLTLMSMVSLAPMVLQHIIKRRRDADAAHDNGGSMYEEQDLLQDDAESIDMMMDVDDDDDDDASLAEKGSNPSLSGDDQDAEHEGFSVDHKYPTILSGLFDMRTWRTSSHSGTSDLPISLHDFNIEHTSRFKHQAKRYSSPPSTSYVSHARQPSVKRAVAHVVA